jgi:hypothetical protein
MGMRGCGKGNCVSHVLVFGLGELSEHAALLIVVSLHTDMKIDSFVSRGWGMSRYQSIKVVRSQLIDVEFDILIKFVNDDVFSI